MQRSNDNPQDLATSQWMQCGAAFDFELATFQETGRDAIHIFGQSIKCPHCSEETIVSIPIPETPTSELPQRSGAPSSKPKSPIGHKRNFISCPTCREQISKNAASCPKCGHEFRSPGGVNMSDPIHFIGILICILLLMTCVVWMLLQLGAINWF